MAGSSGDITVILNLYRRPDYLWEQLEAIKSQTVQPKEVWLWVNAHKENRRFNPHNLGFDKVIKSSHNYKYHARFSLALLAQTEYVAMFDDDTIPGRKWFENCLDTMKETPGIMGGAGVILHDRHYVNHTRSGWPERNEETVEVDLVGHAWFFKREDLNHMWRETPVTLENGEDIQFGYSAKKYGGVKSYCPPHPVGDPDLHSSRKPERYGNDNRASSNGSLMSIPEFYHQRDFCISHAVDNGWETVLGVG